MSERTDVTVTLSEETKEAIENRLEYGDSRSQWIKEACEQRLEKEAAAAKN